MERATNTNNNLLVNQVRKFHRSEWQVQRTIKNNRVKEHMPELKTGLKHLEKQSSENSIKLKKTKLCIKNMVSFRCKMTVKAVLENLGINFSKVELGEVEIIGNLSDTKKKQLKSNLSNYGLELLEDKKIILVENIKKVIVEMVHYSDEQPKINFSYYLSEKLNYNYNYLSNLFSEVKGMSIQHFIIAHKIERVKELLIYEDLSLSEIGWKLKYSSVAHLSSQFKKITGLSPSHFKNISHKRLRALEDL